MERSVARLPSTSGSIKNTPYQAFCVRKKIRVLSVACYFGFAPLIWLAEIGKKDNKFLHHHFLHSLVLSLLIFFVVVATAITDALAYIFAVFFWNPSPRDIAAKWWLVRFFDYTGDIIVLIWILAWLFLVVNAWRGESLQIPILTGFAQRKNWMRFSLGWTIFTRVVLLILFLIAIHGEVLTMHPGNSPQVYILYTVGGYIPNTGTLWSTYTPPHWTFSLFFYPIVAAASIHWGHGAVDIEPLSDASFKKAIQNGRFVFVASHGGNEEGSFTYSFAPYRGFSPSDLHPGDAGSQLRYVYFAACYAGNRESDWRKVLAPAEVKSYARISYVEEHFLWVWLKGAKVILNIK